MKGVLKVLLQTFINFSLPTTLNARKWKAKFLSNLIKFVFNFLILIFLLHIRFSSLWLLNFLSELGEISWKEMLISAIISRCFRKSFIPFRGFMRWMFSFFLENSKSNFILKISRLTFDIFSWGRAQNYLIVWS